MIKFIFSALLLIFSIQPISCKHYAVIHDRDAGFFSNFLTVLGIAYQYEIDAVNGFHVSFINQGFYHDATKDTNWWNNYFEPIQMPNIGNESVQVYALMDSASCSYFSVKIDRYLAHTLIERHIHVKSYIKSEVDAFVSKYFKPYVIGIHYRGTDKFWSKEAKALSYDDVVKAVTNVVISKIKNGSDYRIFVATDDLNFLKHMKKVFRNHVIYQNCIRSTDARPIHYVFEGTAAATGKKTPHGFQLGKEALIDALLLSRCNYLLRTNSNLSLCSTYFNPNIEVVVLND